MALGRQGVVPIFGCRDGLPAGRPKGPLGCRGHRRLPPDLVPQHLLLLGLGLLLLRPQVRDGDRRRERHHYLGRYRRRTAVEAHLRGQPRVLGLATGQLLPGCPRPRGRRVPPGRGARPPVGRPVPVPGGRPARCRVGGCRLGDHVDADRQVGRGARPDPSRCSNLRPGCRGLRRRRGRWGARARGGPGHHPNHGPRDRRQLPVRGAHGHLDLVPVRHQHRRRPQPGDQQVGRDRRHPVAQRLPDDLRLLHGPRTHPVLRSRHLRRAPAAVGGQRGGS